MTHKTLMYYAVYDITENSTRESVIHVLNLSQN